MGAANISRRGRGSRVVVFLLLLSLLGTVTVAPTPRRVDAAETFAAGSSVEVIDPQLYLRSGPGFATRVLAHMALGTQAIVLQGPERANGHPWYEIQTSAYGRGWASGRYLKAVGPGALLTKPTDGLSRVIRQGESGRDEVAITIDAGADRGWAEEMLDVLEQNEVKATFGMTGAWAEENLDLLQRMVDEGHQLINHTWSHASFTGFSASPAVSSSADRKSELDRTADFVLDQTDYDMTPFWRPPYGDIDSTVLQDMYDAGYWQTVMWSIDSMGWDGASVSQILNSCAWNAKPGDIILLHVGYSSQDYAALDQMITILDGRGFDLVTIEELLK